MSECEKLSKCAFFNDRMANMPATAEMFKKNYCLGDKTVCARYQVAITGKEVPVDLFPNQTERAKQIIGS